MSSDPLPRDDLPLYGDDEDDDGVKAKYLSNLPYTEIMYSPIEVDLTILAEVDYHHPHLYDDEFQFVDYAIRKILKDDGFYVWDVEVESHQVLNLVGSPLGFFQCDYHGLFSVGLQVNKYETDVLGLKEEMKASLWTSMNTGKFNRALIDAFDIQLNTLIHRAGERVEEFKLVDMNVYNNEMKIATIVSALAPELPHSHAYYNFLAKDEDPDVQVVTTTKHRFTHTYVALTVFALTLACLLWSYGCFMSRTCRRVGKKIPKRKERTKDIDSCSESNSQTGVEEEGDTVEIVLSNKSDIQDANQEAREGTETSDLDEIVNVDLENNTRVHDHIDSDTIAF